MLRTAEELAYELGLLDAAELERVTVGIDRGVAIPVALSDGAAFDIAPVCRTRIDKKERAARRHQRRLARQVKGSKNRAKTRQRIARCKGYGANVRQDFAHQTSHALVASSARVFVFEDLKLKNMTAAPAAKQDAAGRYTANGAAAKAGLNKAILASALGLVRQFTTYKAARCNKLVLGVSPYRSSQECAECGHSAAENRPSQAVFACGACGHANNADHNAARVLHLRGVAQLKAGVPAKKQKKTARVRGTARGRIKVGLERPEPDESPMPVENISDGVGGMAANDAAFDEAGNRHLNASRH